MYQFFRATRPDFRFFKVVRHQSSENFKTVHWPFYDTVGSVTPISTHKTCVEIMEECDPLEVMPRDRIFSDLEKKWYANREWSFWLPTGYCVEPRCDRPMVLEA